MDSQLRVVGDGGDGLSFVFGRAQVTERRVATLAVVEHLDVIEDVGPGFRSILVVAVAGQFGFERSEEALGHDVVVAVSSTAHAACDPGLRQQRLCRPAKILLLADDRRPTFGPRTSPIAYRPSSRRQDH